MSTLTLPRTLVPGAFENVNDVQDNFVAIRTLVNGGLDGDNFSQATAEAVSASATNASRHGLGSTLLLNVTTGSYVQLLRAPVVVMPTVGILHVSMFVTVTVSPSTTRLISYAIRLNGTTAKSRFGAVSAASGGLMEVTGLGITSPGTPTGGILYTGNTDNGLDALLSTNGGGATQQTQPVGVFVPIAVAAGSYVVDVVAKVDSGDDVGFANGKLWVKAEGF